MTDLDGDDFVGYGDLEIVAAIFASREGDSRFNPAADFDGNGLIDIVDLMIVAQDFGKVCYDLTIDVLGEGTTDPGPGSHKCVEDRVVNIAAIPDSGWRFKKWSGKLYSRQNPLTIFMNYTTNITAEFDEIPQVSYQIYGLDFSPYTEEGQNQNYKYTVSEEQLRDRMETIAPYTHWIRTFGSLYGLEKAGLVAHELGLKAAIGCWLDPNSTAFLENERQISSLINIAKKGQADLLIVGSETLQFNRLTEGELIGYINRVKQAVPGIPVGTADTYNELLAHQNVTDACDVIFPNYYPYWEGKNLTYAIHYIQLWHQQIVTAAKGKPVVISETGWPSEGNSTGDAAPSPENAAYFFLNFVSWARTNNISYFYFEAFDELWKGEGTVGVGPHWGLWFRNSTLKPGIQDVFDNKTIADNWSTEEIPGGPGEPTIEFTYVPPYGSSENLRGQVWHVKPSEYHVAVYIKVGTSWYTKPYWASPLTPIMPDGVWICDIVTGGIDQTAKEIAAFLIAAGYNPPLMYGGSNLPTELYEKSVKWVNVTR
jgi:exo-beta-1,3-glucanase (GH17 family)